MEKKILIAILISVIIGLVIGLAIAYMFSIYSKDFSYLKQRVCPEAWWDNQMPCACVTEACLECEFEREYLIVNGERREISEFDLDWIKENCEVNEPTPVY